MEGLQGVMREEYSRDLTNLDLAGRGWEIVIYADFFIKCIDK